MSDTAWVRPWIYETALPLWSEVGIDNVTGTAWEALSHNGQPLQMMERRLRVQLRQSKCFADLGAVEPARRLFDWVAKNGFDPVSGHLAARLSSDMQQLSAPNDLYDLAFAWLAAAALIRRGAKIDVELERFDAAIAGLKAPRGWFEDAAHRLPRTQNSHMHLFEAATELYSVTSEARYRIVAEECLDLFTDRFISPDGRVLEFFSDNWVPLTGTDQATQPGHMAEWISLIHRYNEVMRESSKVDFDTLWCAVLARRDKAGFLPDSSDPDSRTRRLWPQTELIRAASVMEKRGDCSLPALPLLESFRHIYLSPSASGGWYDQFSDDGVLMSDNMPASSFYHILGCLLPFIYV